MNIRTYEDGDEDEIAKLLNECFDSFRSSSLTGETWLKVFDFDTGYRKDLAFVAEKDGRIVSHVQLVERDLTVGRAATLKIAGIANVSTLRDHRRDGISTKLIAHAIEDAKEQGFPATALFTGAQIPAHRIYQRLGLTDVYFPVLLLRGAKTPLVWITDKSKPQITKRGIRIRESEEKDDPSIVKVYERNYNVCNGFAVRRMDTWKSKFRKLLVYECPFYEEEPKPSNILVAEAEDGEIIGYAVSVLARRDKLGHVCEVLTNPGEGMQAGRPLAERVLSNLSEEKPVSNIIYSSNETLIDALFRRGSTLVEGVSVFMHKTLDLNATLESSLQPILSPEANHIRNMWDDIGPIAISISGESIATVNCAGESISTDQGRESRHEIKFEDNDSFAKLLYGARSLKELLSDNKIKLSLRDTTPTKVINLFEAIYPRKPVLTCPGDWW
jgi:predicted N-acetyltransferase YhbS